MYRTRFRRPLMLVIAVVISILVMTWVSTTPEAMESGAQRSQKSEDREHFKDRTVLYPELALENGYFVSHEEAAMRGGVGNYVPRPNGKEREKLALYRDVATYATFYRDQDGMLQIRMNRGILFDSDSAQLTDTAKSRLDRVANLMRLENIEYVEIFGHADNVGSEGYNERLSERRALVVRDYLGARVAGREFASFAEGENDPIAPNTTEAGRSLNRRTEIILSE